MYMTKFFTGENKKLYYDGLVKSKTKEYDYAPKLLTVSNWLVPILGLLIYLITIGLYGIDDSKPFFQFFYSILILIIYWVVRNANIKKIDKFIYTTTNNPTRKIKSLLKTDDMTNYDKLHSGIKILCIIMLCLSVLPYLVIGGYVTYNKMAK